MGVEREGVMCGGLRGEGGHVWGVERGGGSCVGV